MERWLAMSAAALGREIGMGNIDPVALTQKYLDAIHAHPFKDRIYTVVTDERALSEAAGAADRAVSGQRRSILDGVPVSWKDLFDSAGIVTEAGSLLLKGRTPNSDCEVLKNATSLGLVCLGKTHMSELAFSGLGFNPQTETSPCINDHSAVAGGSSSGAAASVAFGLAAMAIGSDTGGSVRVPAAWNDLVGLKTTSDRLSLSGVVPLCARFDTIGPLCRSVEDASFALAALEGDKPVNLTNANLEGCRFAVCKTAAFDDIRELPKKAFDNSIKRLQAMGAVVEYINIPTVTEALGLTGILFPTEAYGTWKHEIESNPEAMFEEILLRFRSGSNVLASDYVAAWQALDQLRAEYSEATAAYDAILMPSSPILPPNIDRLAQDHDYYVTENLLALRNTRIGNLMGACALTLPTGVPSCGFMILCPPMGEHRLLRLGAAVENAMA
jgi:aspartyl-tRNA(Asn)/glutamyl-tRNA(Gln) amidotransferase subunit A|tara:strand:- start:4740 stop:6068 length:1329 start_codon:yes stop_codon:yes gene_type:complete